MIDGYDSRWNGAGGLSSIMLSGCLTFEVSRTRHTFVLIEIPLGGDVAHVSGGKLRACVLQHP